MPEITMQKIVPCLWFDGTAREAAEHYIEVFGNGKILGGEDSPADNPSTRQGEEMVVQFELFGHQFTGLNGGPQFKFNESVSFQVDCADQAEVDKYWDGLLTGGGEESQCGWIRDKYGLSWQIVPRRLNELLSDPDPARAKRAMECMLQQIKLNVADLEAAANGK